LLAKIYIFGENLDFCLKFRFFIKNSVLDKNFNFGKNLDFGQNLDFCLKFRFLPKI